MCSLPSKRPLDKEIGTWSSQTRQGGVCARQGWLDPLFAVLLLCTAWIFETSLDIGKHDVRIPRPLELVKNSN